MWEPVWIMNVQYSVPVVILIIFIENSIVVIIDVINMIPGEKQTLNLRLWDLC